MKDILKVMEFAFFNPEQYKEDYVRSKFGDKKYNKFSQFCLGGTTTYAHFIGDGKLKLTQEGVREYHKLKNYELQTAFNFWLVIFTAIMAVATLLGVILR